MKKRLLALSLCVFVQGCTQVDDYMLGKDNTPKPKELKQIDSKITISKNWSSSTGRAYKRNEYLKLKPVIHKNIVYTADASGLVQATNKNNGTVLWTTQLQDGIVSGPAINDGFIALGTNASSVVLLAQATGKELWQSKVSGELLSPPALAHKKVVAKTIDGKVYAFDALSGKSLWVVDHGSPNLVLKASSSPIIVNNLVIIGFSDGKMDALDLDSGRLVWQKGIAYATGASDVERLVDIDSDPIVKDNVAYIASYQGFIGALSLTDGQFLWKRSGSVYKNMVLKSNVLYLTDSEDVVWAIDSRTGLVIWKQTSLKARELTEPVVLGNDLVVGDKTGYMHVLSSETGALIARSLLGSGISISPAVEGKKLYVLTDNGMLNQLSVG